MTTRRNRVLTTVFALALTAALLHVTEGQGTAKEAAAKAADITGSYTAKGTNPGGKGGYTGTVTITKAGDVYKVVWSVGSAYEGTGIRTGDVLAVAYTDAGKTWFGVVSYKIDAAGKQLVGQWTSHGGSALGTETLTRTK